MKSRRRGRGPRPAWNWATTGSLVFQDTTVGSNISISGPLMPAPRVDWLLENGRGRDHITVTGILLWLDFVWQNPNETPLPCSAVDFWVLKERFDAAPGASKYQPYQSPDVPANMVSWVVNDPVEELDGLDPYLWTHHLSELVSGSLISAISPAGAANTTDTIGGGQIVQPMVNCRQAWQPDVVIRTRRKLMKGDCLNIGFNSQTGTGNGMYYSLTYRARILTS